jgi:hypothetical protein
MKARKIANAPEEPEPPDPEAEAAEPLTGAFGPERGAAGALVACRPGGECIRGAEAAANVRSGATKSLPVSASVDALEARAGARLRDELPMRGAKGPETTAGCAVGVETVTAVVSGPSSPLGPGEVGEPPVGGVDEPPLLGGSVPLGGAVLAEPFTVVPLESTETDVEPTVASTCELEGALTPVLVDATGVEVELETDTCEGVVLTLDWVEAGGAETAVEAEAAGGAVLALVVTAALAAGVLTDAVALAEGVEETEAFTEAETLGV